MYICTFNFIELKYLFYLFIIIYFLFNLLRLELIIENIVFLV